MNKTAGLWMLGMAGAYFIAAYIFVAIHSLGYPYPLEITETIMMDSVQRVRDGLSLYTQPTLEFMPLLYTPFYYYASAAMSYLVGMEMFAGRLVSFLSTLGIAAVLYAWLRREQAPRALCFFGAASYFATYIMVMQWFHLVRVDSLMLFLLLAGLYALRFADTTREAFVAGALLALAVLTKQQAALIGAAALLAVALFDWRKALTAGLATGGIVFAILTLLHLTTDGWSTYWTVEMPVSLPSKGEQWKVFLIQDYLINAGIVLLLAFYAVVRLWRRDLKSGVFYAFTLLGALIICMFSRIHVGGWQNTLMPAYALLCLLGALALAQLYQGRANDWFLAACGMLLQLLMWGYLPQNFVLTPEDKARAEGVMEGIAALPGEVFIADVQWLQTKAGKKTYALRYRGYDVLQASERLKPGTKQHLMEEIETALHTRKFSYLLMQPESLPNWQCCYEHQGPLKPENGFRLIGQSALKLEVFTPKTALIL